MDDDAYAADLKARWLAMAGFVLPQYEFLARKDPEFTEELFSMMDIWRREDVIPMKDKELMIVLAMAVKLHDVAIRTHMRRAIELGATQEELVEVSKLAMLAGGLASMTRCLGILMDLTGEAGDEPITPQWLSDGADPSGGSGAV